MSTVMEMSGWEIDTVAHSQFQESGLCPTRDIRYKCCWHHPGILQGVREKFGQGVYSTPYVSEAFKYAKTFIHEGKRYKGILQNRINPQKRQKHNNGKYCLIPIPSGTSKKEEQQKMQESIRPYGLLLKEIQQAGKGHKKIPISDYFFVS